MIITRNGKIARLPREIREQLNIKLDDGMEAGPILEWVNELPETKKVVAELFEGKPINPQNLSDWRQGGYQDWLRARERAELAGLVLEEGEEFAGTAKGANLSQRLGVAFALELAAQLRRWQRETGEPQARWRQLRELYRELAELRREDHRAQRLKIAQEKWAWEEEALEEAKELKERESQQREAEALFKRAKNALYFWGRSAEAMVGETEVVRAINRGKALPEWVQRLLAERDGREEGPESRRLSAAAAQWEAKQQEQRKGRESRPRYILDELEREAERGKSEAQRPKAEGNPKTETARNEGEYEDEKERSGNGAGAGMTNDECPMTKEARMTKSEGNRAVQRAEAEGSPRSEVQSGEGSEEGQQDTSAEGAQAEGAWGNQGESSPIKADQIENDVQAGVQGGEGCQDPPSLRSYGAASPPR